jgi:hypothetical protein
VSSDPDLKRQLPENKRTKLNIGFEVFIAMGIQMVVFWVVAVCSILDVCQT